MIEVIYEKKEWCALLAMVEHSDFYHTYDYHDLSKNNEDTPVLVKYTDGLTALVLPLLIRNISNSIYKDATSVYGYVGILKIHIDAEFNKANFHKELNDYFFKNNIIAVFSRLHPYLEESESILDGLGKITPLGKVVNIDLTETVANQRAKYNRRLKTYLNKSRRSCTVFEGNVEEHLETFKQLYLNTMHRIDADESYLFDTEYYYRLLTSKDINSKLMLCKHNKTQEIIAGAIFLQTGHIVQYHLSGVNEAYFELQPIKLIIDEMRIQATNKGYKYFNLGGGKGSKEDSLFSFKKRFSKNFKDFKIWRLIVDNSTYKALAKNHLGTQVENEDIYNGYFPAYRSPLQMMSSFLVAIEGICLHI